MNRLLIKTVLILAAAAPFAAPAQELPPCVETAAAEFGLPVKVFKSLVLVTQKDQDQQQAPHFGAMSMHEKAIAVAAKGIHSTADSIKTDACESYRASAWWLAVQADANNEADIWEAVNRYFNGPTPRPDSIATDSLITDRVKMVYEQLD